MNIQIPQNIKDLVNKINSIGIPLPMIRDCLSQQPSLTYTLVVVYSVVTLLGTLTPTQHLVDFNKSYQVLQWILGTYVARQTMKHLMPLDNSDNSNNS